MAPTLPLTLLPRAGEVGAGAGDDRLGSPDWDDLAPPAPQGGIVG